MTANKAIAEVAAPDIAPDRALGDYTSRTSLPEMRCCLLERRVRRADLSALQGIERLVKRRAR